MTETLTNVDGIPCLINRAASAQARLVLAHGAGKPMDSDFMQRVAELLCERQIEVVRFEFPYMAKRRQSGTKRPPDRLPVLLDTWRQVIDAWLDTDDLPLFIGGKSMGGRMATLMAADDQGALPRGVVCLGYPFHPRGKPEKTRTAHLATLTIPTLIVQGTRDPMGSKEDVASYALSSAVVMAWLETANHDLKPLLKSGFSAEEYWVQTADRVAAFIRLVG